MSTPEDEENAQQLRSILVLVAILAVIGALVGYQHFRSAGSPTTTTTPGFDGPGAPQAAGGDAPQKIAPAQPPLQREDGLTSNGDRCVSLGGGTVGLTVVTYNIHSGLAGGRLQLDAMAGALQSWGPDIALVQEVSRNRGRVRHADEPTALATGLDLNPAYGVNWLPPDGGEYGVLTLSRYPIVSTTNTPLPNAPGAQPRGLLRTVVDVDGTQVAVYNTHLQPGFYSLRLRQMGAIMAILAKEKLPIVLGGDLNTVPSSPVISMTRSLLGDSFGQVGTGDGETIPAPRPNKRVDFLLHSADLVPVQSQVMPLTASDHRAVRTVFRLPGVDDEVCIPVLSGAASRR